MEEFDFSWQLLGSCSTPGCLLQEENQAAHQHKLAELPWSKIFVSVLFWQLPQATGHSNGMKKITHPSP